MDVVLPITINKFMKFRQGLTKQGFKDAWKQIKANATTVGYRHFNAKFVRIHAEVNKYFDNCLLDISTLINPKEKKKYGGVFVLPDNNEYYLKITLDSSRMKIHVGARTRPGGNEEWVAQYLSFLLTV